MTNHLLSRRLFISTALSLPLLPLSSFANTDVVPFQAAVKHIINELNFLFINPPLPTDKKISKIQSFWKKHFATPIISRFVLGKYARAANKSQLQRFQTVFSEVNSFSLIKQIENFEKPNVTFTRTLNMKSNTVMVFTLFKTNNGQKIDIGWRVLKRNNTFQIVDIVIADISMLQTFRSEYSAYLRGNKGNINALIAELEKRLLSLKASSS